MEFLAHRSVQGIVSAGAEFARGRNSANRRCALGTVQIGTLRCLGEEAILPHSRTWLLPKRYVAFDSGQPTCLRDFGNFESVRIVRAAEVLANVAEKHPYASPGAVTAAVAQFRRSLPAKVSADTLRKLSIAPNNESYVINTLRFIGAIDPEGNKTDTTTAAFNQHGLGLFNTPSERW